MICNLRSLQLHLRKHQNNSFFFLRKTAKKDGITEEDKGVRDYVFYNHNKSEHLRHIFIFLTITDDFLRLSNFNLILITIGQSTEFSTDQFYLSKKAIHVTVRSLKTLGTKKTGIKTSLVTNLNPSQKFVYGIDRVRLGNKWTEGSVQLKT